MPFFLGIDGGGSKTVCLLADATSVLARASSGPSNIIRVGAAKARESLHEVIRDACEQARVSCQDIQATCVGAAGAGRAEIADQIRCMLGEILDCPIRVVPDMVIALEAAFAGGPGLVVISGTGSVAFGRNEHGQTARAGGWGFAISDEGSGYWIGREAVSALFRARDRGEKLNCESEILKQWELTDLDDLTVYANSAQVRDFAGLFPMVASLAEAGDRIARETLARAANELAALVSTAAARLWGSAESFVVAMAGGVFQHSRFLREEFKRRISVECPSARQGNFVEEPATGALYLAQNAITGKLMQSKSV